MNFKGWTSRPAWAKGAHIFVTPGISDEVEDAFQDMELGKGDIVVSHAFLGLVHRALAAPAKDGLAHNRGSKQPKLKSQDAVTLAPLSPSDAARARADVPLAERLLDPVSYELLETGTYADVSVRKVGTSPSISTRQTHTTGSRPREQPAADRSYGTCRKKFHLGKSPESIALASPEVALPVGPDPGDSSSSANAGKLGGVGSGGRGTDACKGGPNGEIAAPSNILQEDPDAAAFRDARSECTMYTCATDLLLDEDSEGQRSRSVLEFVRQRLCDVPTPMSSAFDTGEEFAAHVDECMQWWCTDVVQPLLDAEPLEDSLATLTGDASVDIDHAKTGQDMLAGVVRCCLSKEVLSEVFGVGSGPAMQAAAQVEAALRPVFKRSKREQRISLKKQMQELSRPDGLHEVAQLLRRMVADAARDALSTVDVVDIGMRSWESYHGSYSALNAKGVAPLPNSDDESALLPTRVTRIIEKESQRRVNKTRKGAAPGHRP
mmetsp:Transcript_98637/g.299362  ORF Transcript_98637/g.299362 Transcript_98637/m.299362 type:complete len:492 (+) Transcript_98637:1-1476(+)